VEEVADPHNFPLSILTQYGPLGLAGFLMMIFVPLWKAIFHRPVLSSTKAHQPQPNLRKFAIPFAIAISVLLLLFRPILIPIKTGGVIDVTIGVMIYAVFILYIAPVVAFAVGLWLLTANQDKNEHAGLRYTHAALFCAVCGFLIHNLIDFAIFEPGVVTVFWAIMACLVAMDYHQKPRPQILRKPAPLVRMLITAAALLLIWACFNYALVPVVKSTTKISQANQASLLGQFDRAHSLLAAAAKDDPLSPAASSANAELHLHRFNVTPGIDRSLIDRARENILEAIDCDKAYFRNFERLTEVYTVLAEISRGQEKTDCLNKALETADQAIKRYPGCGRLHIKRAKIAEQLGKTGIAIEHYEETINIEDRYRDQFRRMYPEEEIFSRLGEETYQFAKQKIKELSKLTTP
jgi:tetratricopeptide (TPR) repeat protein